MVEGEELGAAFEGVGGNPRWKLEELGLIELVQTMSLGMKDARVELAHAELGVGVLYFDGGRIVAARTRANIGDEAFYEMARWTEGEFTTFGGEQCESPNIETSNDALILEALRRAEEPDPGGSPSAPAAATLKAR